MREEQIQTRPIRTENDKSIQHERKSEQPQEKTTQEEAMSDERQEVVMSEASKRGASSEEANEKEPKRTRSSAAGAETEACMTVGGLEVNQEDEFEKDDWAIDDLTGRSSTRRRWQRRERRRWTS